MSGVSGAISQLEQSITETWRLALASVSLFINSLWIRSNGFVSHRFAVALWLWLSAGAQVLGQCWPSGFACFLCGIMITSVTSS